MKKMLSVLLLIPFLVQAQTKPVVKEAEKLPDLKTALTVSLIFNKLAYQTHQVSTAESYIPISASGIAGRLSLYLAKEEQSLTNKLLKKDSSSIVKMFNALDYFGDAHTAKFFFNENSPYPVIFATNNDGGSTLIVSGILIPDVYNTLKLTSKQRQTKVVQSYLLPALKSVDQNFTNSNIKYFGFTAIYGSKDLSNDDESIASEFVSLIAPVSSIRKYLNGDITDEAFMKAVDIYAADKDNPNDLMKIAITLL